jgi:hypothetical protein
MRVKIGVNKFPYSGYLNIDPDPIISSDIETHISSIRNLDNILDERECDTVILDECLCYIPHQEIGDYIHYVISKIKRGGELVILDQDTMSLSYDYYCGLVDEQIFNEKLFGNQDRPSLFKTCCLSLRSLKDFLSENYTITHIEKNNEHNFILKVKNE